ncbi:MAG TPA: Jag N-terminal domain-containing protein, partial [Tepidiformaceae bacterium]|nr:Jag N-terminal domain-containing protein [Tepidiformaceae bacterium]
MDQAEASGKTVEDALSRALAKLNASREEVEFVVLDEGKRGGLFGRGSRDALVRVNRLSPSQRSAAPAQAPDTRIPRGQQSGARQGGRQRGSAAGGGQRRDGSGGQGGGGQRRGQQGSRGSVEPAMPRLTDADFARPGAARP